MANNLKVLQIGGNPIELSSEIDAYYVDLTEIEEAEIDDEPIMLSNKINPILNDFIFLVPEDSSMIGDLSWLEIFPANSVVLASEIEIPEEYQDLANLLNVQYLSFIDEQQLSQKLIVDFFKGQTGIEMMISRFQFSPQNKLSYEVLGEGTLIIHGTNSETLTYLGTYGKPAFVLGSQQFEVLPECDVIGEDTNLEFHVRMMAPNSDYDETIIIKDKAIHELTALPIFDEPMHISISVYGSGQGDIYLGVVHLRKSREGHGTAMIGGESQIANTHMTQETIFFFDAGDLKPPLNVYFSGYRLAAGFEGYFMMKGMGAPFILINDPRMVGGQFYVGDQKLERNIVEYIERKLSDLGFNQQDLVLSGLSMGSFGALYYAADLVPGTVIAGKPLVNLGTIAKNARINRPNDFDVSLDMMLSWVGGTKDTDVAKANTIFWKKFKKVDFSKTEFIFSYMKDDDYDKNAFRELNDYLREKFPTIKIIHKGFIGRHNDNNDGLIGWFLSQFYRVLENKFKR